MVDEISNWRKGQLVKIRGVIKTTMFGQIQLDNCSLSVT
jgi:hypothetical protein